MCKNCNTEIFEAYIEGELCVCDCFLYSHTFGRTVPSRHTCEEAEE